MLKAACLVEDREVPEGWVVRGGDEGELNPSHLPIKRAARPKGEELDKTPRPLPWLANTVATNRILPTGVVVGASFLCL